MNYSPPSPPLLHVNTFVCVSQKLFMVFVSRAQITQHCEDVFSMRMRVRMNGFHVGVPNINLYPSVYFYS